VTGTGNALANQLRGNAAANTLDGGAGNDSMLGGAGNDTYIVDSSLDVVQEFTVPDGTLDAGGTDTVQATVNYILGSFVENLTLGGGATLSGTGNGSVNLITGNAAANKLFGLGGADTLQGGGGNDSLDGGLQADVMRGGAGNDTYVVNVSTDVVDETTGGIAADAGGIDTVRSLASAYTLSQFVENLSLSGAGNIGGTGNDKANVITGNAGSNAINGAGGADIIKAGAGNDILTGGLGADTFVFNTALSSSTNIDTINDWDTGGAQDKIQLDDDIFLALGKVTATTALDATMFVKGKAALDGNDHIIYDQSSGALYYDADGVGAAAQVQFATLVSNATLGTHPGVGLTAADFFVVV
jgi:Ca2+-binding RTX toxin-like protein